MEKTLAVGERFAVSVEEVDEGAEHIVRLLTDAGILFHSGSYATATFVAITAIEKTTKLHMGMYRTSEAPVARRKDPLYRHDQKHHLAAAPTLLIGGRLQAAIGVEAVESLIEYARNGELVTVREAALYMERKDQLQVPLDHIDRAIASRMVLFAVEVFDDVVVGYTHHSHTLRTQTDAIFEGIVNAELGS